MFVLGISFSFFLILISKRQKIHDSLFFSQTIIKNWCWWLVFDRRNFRSWKMVSKTFNGLLFMRSRYSFLGLFFKSIVDRWMFLKSMVHHVMLETGFFFLEQELHFQHFKNSNRRKNKTMAKLQKKQRSTWTAFTGSILFFVFDWNCISSG